DGVVVGTAPPGNAATPIVTVAASARRAPVDFVMQEYPVTRGQGPHDVAPARDGGVWYTAQLSGELGWLDPRFGVVKAIKLGAGSAPHGVIVGPDGAAVLAPPTPGQGARRVWCDSKSRVWVSEWNSGELARYDGNSWKEWKLPGDRAMAYAVYVDDADVVWVTDWGANSLVRFDPATETFVVRSHPSPNA